MLFFLSFCKTLCQFWIKGIFHLWHILRMFLSRTLICSGVELSQRPLFFKVIGTTFLLIFPFIRNRLIPIYLKDFIISKKFYSARVMCIRRVNSYCMWHLKAIHHTEISRLAKFNWCNIKYLSHFLTSKNCRKIECELPQIPLPEAIKINLLRKR